VGLPADSENLFYYSYSFMTVQMQMDIARFSKLIFPKDTRHNEQREVKLLKRCPRGHEGKKLVNEPAIILDASSAIIAWYLPDTLIDTTQVSNMHCYSMDIAHKMKPTEGNQRGHRFAHFKPQNKCKG
jgi:hypothetical protein